MNDLIFQDKENSFGVVLSNENYVKIIDFCECSYPYETGGIIVGYYSSDSKLAKITRIIGPPKFSRHSRSNFFRSNYGIKPILEKEWCLGNYYLGEWHYHPNFSSAPSHTDISQMKSFSRNGQLNCPEPILLIIGGNRGNWDISVNVVCKCIIPLDVISKKSRI